MTTLQNIIDTIRLRTDTVNSNFITDAELVLYVNSSLAEMDDILVQSYEDYKISSQTSAAASFLILPSDFYMLRGVDYVYDTVNNYSVTLKPFNFQERNDYKLQQLTTRPYVDVRYRIEGSTIVFMPVPSSGNITIWYTPKYAPLDLVSNQTLASYMDLQSWHEYAVVDCAIKVLQKQDLDPSVFMNQKEALKARIIKSCINRDAGSPKTFINTRRRVRVVR